MTIAKSRFAFIQNVESFIAHFGIENCGFLTLTFPDAVFDAFEASERFNSLRTGFLSKIMNAYIGVYERHKSGVVHFHFVIALNENIAYEYRKGNLVVCDYKAIMRGDYRSAPKALRKLWAKFREVLPRYGFGRHQLLPVSTDKGISRYLAKYLTKGIQERQQCDKGFRLVRSTSGKKAVVWKKVSCSFAWLDKGRDWRSALRHYIFTERNVALKKMKSYKFYGKDVPEQVQKLAQMNEDNYSVVMCEVYGKSWCYLEKDWIIEAYIRDSILQGVDTEPFEKLYGKIFLWREQCEMGDKAYYQWLRDSSIVLNDLIARGWVEVEEVPFEGVC